MSRSAKKRKAHRHPVLTDRQVQVMYFIQTYIKRNRRSPSYREIGDAVGLTVAPVAYQINNLIRLGYLEKFGRRALRVEKLIVLSEKERARDVQS